MHDRFFNPTSVAIIGASERSGSVGRAVAENMLSAPFGGRVWLVNPKYHTLFGRKCYGSVRDLPGPADLAVIVSPARTVAPLVAELAARVTGAAIVITAGLSQEEQVALLEKARAGGMRILGPNCLGLLLPYAGLNASFAPLDAQQGRLVFLSQSGAILTSALDWAAARSIGFSGMVSLGNAIDIDLPELIDHFAEDPRSAAILIYLEAIRDAREFLSSARRAARLKPVVVMKVGRHAEGARAALSHTGALAGSDLVYDAAFRRCGLVRVHSLEELFDAAELLSLQRPFIGKKLAIVTNGGGAGIIAADCLRDNGGELAVLGGETLKSLDRLLPASWSRANPVDIVGDADAARYAAALETVLGDGDVHAALVLRCPTSISSAESAARSIRDTVLAHRERHDWHKPVLTCWLGGETVVQARKVFEQAAIPTFDSPEDAVRALSHLVAFSEARETVLRQPVFTEHTLAVDRQRARALVEERVKAGGELLDEREAKDLLDAYGIPVARTHVAQTPQEVAEIAARLLSGEGSTDAVVLKIVSPDITHKSDVGGVHLDIRTADEARMAAETMLATVAAAHPQARLTGVAVQPMITKLHGRSLILGINRDRTFGATLLFGAGGTAVEVIDDKAMELPPLDDNLAHAMIARTRISRLLAGYRHVPAVDLGRVVEALMRVSRLARDVPEIAELDINPLLADDAGVVALDARVVLRPLAADCRDSHLAIAPWPEQTVGHRLDARRDHILIRPILATDEALYPEFFAHMSKNDIRMRLFAFRRHFDHGDFARWTQIDFEREMALVALDEECGQLLGVARYVSEPEDGDGEFALIVRSDRQMRGIGTMLMRELLSYANVSGLVRLHGVVLKENDAMRGLCRDLGFEEADETDDTDSVVVSRRLARKGPGDGVGCFLPDIAARPAGACSSNRDA